MRHDEATEMFAFVDMRIAREDEGADAHLLISLDLGQYLIGRTDKRGTAA